MAQSPFSAVTRTTRIGSAVETNKLIRNTYTLLSVTLLFSALMAGVSVMLRVPPMGYLLSIGAAFLLMWMVLPKTSNSASGIGVVFAITGLMGFALGPIISMYMGLPNGSQIVGTAFGGTAAIFLGLSGYALVSRRDFSFLGGVLRWAGVLALVAIVGAVLFGWHLGTWFSLLMVGVAGAAILYDTSKILYYWPEDRYVGAALELFASVALMFWYILRLLMGSRR